MSVLTTVLYSQLSILLPSHPQYSGVVVAALKELALMGSMEYGEFCTKLISEEAFNILVAGNVVFYTVGTVEFQLKALAWYFSRA